MTAERHSFSVRDRDAAASLCVGSGVVRYGGERTAASLERRKPLRPRHRQPLLIATDAVAVDYLQCLVDGWHLQQEVTLVVCPSKDPQAVIEHGLRAGLERGSQRLYAVVECGSRQFWQQLTGQFAKAEFPVQIVACVPTFHIWLMLHFQELTPAIWADAGQLASFLEQPLPVAVTALLQHRESLFITLGDKIEQAVLQAQRLSLLQQRSVPLYPWTNFQELIQFLLKLRDKHNRLQG
ncbi:MAG: hypothetical protein HQM04_10380 [Magnetococcales bacterium]|nr:hypothetical protein [Magnetococcales bacterium]MBF0115437.1 hypothetical protein [Magnetococcales bacterium]